MTPTSTPDILDENSVFNRLLSEQKRPQRPSPSERLEAIFDDTPAASDVVSVEDFLPRY